MLKEENAERRRVLIEGIGYERIIDELEAKELSSFREYKLFQVAQEVDVEPIMLLTMTCPSTEHKHCLRVPPDMTSAEEAVTWCNWGTHPEEFITEH